MDSETKSIVRLRAQDRCEYCHLPQAATPFITFHIEHVIAKQHTPDSADLDSLERLALACDRCNLFKGPNLASIDPAPAKSFDYSIRDKRIGTITSNWKVG
ncbi:MAG: HNH endonuclease [Planctomycetales bacterium]|nr:HNH endonuclease [Planctomycetales bacterium]